MQLPQKKRPGLPILASDWNQLIDALAARTPRPSADLQVVASSGGFTYRSRETPAASTQKRYGHPFAEIINWIKDDKTVTGIRGGVVQAGNKVWNVPHMEINLEIEGDFLVWLTVEVLAYSEDGVVLPGLITSSMPEVVYGDPASGYPQQVVPTIENPTGTAVVPIGELRIQKKSPSFTPAYYGSVQLSHCPGTILQYRNGEDFVYPNFPS